MRARVAALIATVLAAPLLPTPAYATDTTPSGSPTGSRSVLMLT